MARPRLKRYTDNISILLKEEERATLGRLSEERQQTIAEIMREYMYRGWKEDGVKVEKVL
ncbi:hypothetical protein P0O24_11955 [Methanotrichaceae archaeon M04Ac]|uniref:CopG family transcriptional regulator n=1 Tax=Candidatus Methanocrinis alkalitolerans TaxID=3033395 RepID=A0ABT5XHU9_9EURY|nr:hypothetical protein [Candidatus Methanocrinis alkalitolerans]MDF0594293.1 hypothetical protein [Candidatus Methanocrinis alkalitolerans]